MHDMALQISLRMAEKRMSRMIEPIMASPLRSVLLVLIVISVGCAGPGASLSRDRAEIREESCSSSRQKTESDRARSTTCRSQRTWMEEIHDALSGTATVLRNSNP
jgi:hypothetical protein